jgi:pimeloyl-ACP methyl ester carboxylesterase
MSPTPSLPPSLTPPPTPPGALAFDLVGPPSAPTVLFLHGLGVSRWSWQPQVAALQGDFRVLTVDLPGNGESAGLPWVSLDDTADRLAALLAAHATGGRAHVVGLSLGGYVALRLLERHPAVVASVLVSGVTTRPFPAPRAWRLLFRAMFPLMRLGPVLALNARMLRLSPAQGALMRRDMRALSRESFVRIYEEMLGFALPATPRPPPCPLLAVAGTRETGQILQGLVDFPRAYPGSRTRTVPGAHHGWSGEQPGLFARTVRLHASGEPPPAELHGEDALPPALVPAGAPTAPAAPPRG